MNTKIIRILSSEIKFNNDNKLLNKNLESSLVNKLEQVKQVLLNENDIVAIPTETVYGLAANAYSKEAVGKIFLTKNRPQDNPLIVHISNLDMLKSIVKDGYVNSIYEKLINAFWPGPLTLLFEIDETSKLYKSNATCRQKIVGIRYPKNKVARAIIDYCQIPLAAPSCNLSGKPSGTKAEHCYLDFNSKIKVIVDDGRATLGLESTIFNGLLKTPTILRPGSITLEQIKSVVGTNVETYRESMHQGEKEIPTTPGMKYKHYSPINTKVVTIYYDYKNNSEYYINIIKNNCISNTNRIKNFILVHMEDCNLISKEIYDSLVSFSNSIDNEPCKLHKYTDVDNLGYDLFDIFRQYDELEYELIFMVFSQNVRYNNDKYMALLNRVSKASSFVID